MRIAVMIIGLCLVMVIAVQSLGVMIGGGLSENDSLTGGGATGLMVALLFLLGSAFVIKKPKISVGLFILASVFAFVAASGGFSDLYFWSFVSLALAAMSFNGIKE